MVPDWKNRVIICERTLLYTIVFDLTVEHPFKALQDLMKIVKGERISGVGGCLAIWTRADRLTVGLQCCLPADNVSQKDFDHRSFFSHACRFLNDR